MERLSKLMAWQEKQRATLIQQQQQEIRNLDQNKLRHQVSEARENSYDHNDKDTVNWRVESEDGDDDDDDNGTSNHFSGVVLPEERRMASSVEEIDGKLTKQDELTVCLGNNNKPARSKIGDERPIKPGIDEDHITSFEAFLESSLHLTEKVEVKGHNQPQSTKTRKPFLRCGEGIARFGINQCRVRSKKKKKALQKDGKRPFPAFEPQNIAIVSEYGRVGGSGAVVGDGGDGGGVGSGGGVGGDGRAGGDGAVGGGGRVGVVNSSGRDRVVGVGGGVGVGGVGVGAVGVGTVGVGTVGDDVGDGGGVGDLISRNMVRKVARAGHEEDNVHRREVLPRVSTPTMMRCSSEDSFIVRRNTRLELEQEELIEFEMLEKVADTSFSSQLSLFQDCPPSSVSFRHSHDHHHADNPFGDQPITHVLNNVPCRASSVSRSELLVDTRGYVTKPMTMNISERARLSQCSLEENYDYSDNSDAKVDVNLDETLKGSPSLARGVEFDDNEIWESFSQGSPCMNESTCRSDLQNLSPSSSNCVTVLKLPAQKQLFEEGKEDGNSRLLARTYTGVRAGETVETQSVCFNGFGAVRDPMDCRAKYLASLETCGAAEQAPCVGNGVGSLDTSDGTFSSSMAGHSLIQTSECQQFAECASHHVDQPYTCRHASRSSSVSHDLTVPPSALVSRLFPGLRQVDDQHKNMPLASQTNSNSLLPPLPLESQLPGLVKTPSPVSSAGGESGFRSLSSSSAIISEELRQKLSQLEEEIERYRTENASLARLRKEREESLTYLRGEIAEFKKQKEEELTKFEEFKKEEMRSLKKERKVFEMYKIEALAARDRKDKVDIENLRNELMAVREDLKGRMSRWGSTLSRYRLKIERQEAENRELQADLRMMEQERLRMWQMQLEQDTQAKRKSVEQEECRRGDPVEAGREKKKITNRKSVMKEKAADPKRMLWSEKKVKLISPPAVSRTKLPLHDNINQVASVSSSEKHVKRRPEPAKTKTAQTTNISKKCDIGGSKAGSNVKDYSRLADEIILQVMEEDGDEEGTENGLLMSQDQEKATSFGSGIEQLKENVKPFPQREPSPSPSLVKSSGGDLSASSSSRMDCQQQKEPPQLGKTEVVEPDGSKVISFSNGTRKVVGTDGKSCSVYFFNGDVKHIKPDQTVVYCYSEFNVTQTNYPDGLEVVEFPDHQCEKHYPNGTKEIHFPDNSVKYLYSNGEEESIFPDGLSQRTYPNGDVFLHMPNGIKEFYTAKFKRREYPDGTVKIVYPDGKQEIQYASGRVKIKNQNGNILVNNINNKM